MPEQSQPASDSPGLSRRRILLTTAIGTAAAGLPAIATAAPFPAADGAGGARPAAAGAQSVEDAALALDPPVFLFETRVPPQVRPGPGSQVGISATRGRIGPHSLRWDYAPGADLEVRAPLRYEPDRYRDGDDQATMGTVMTSPIRLIRRPSESVSGSGPTAPRASPPRPPRTIMPTTITRTISP